MDNGSWCWHLVVWYHAIKNLQQQASAHPSPYHHDLCCALVIKISFGGYATTSSVLSCLVLPVSRATPFHIIYQTSKAKRKDSLGRVLPTALRPLPSSFIIHQWTIQRPSLSALVHLFDPLLARRYLFGNQLMLSAWAGVAVGREQLQVVAGYLT